MPLNITYFNTADRSMKRVKTPQELTPLLSSEQGFYWLDLNDANPDNFTQILQQLSIDFPWRNYFDRPEILPHLTDSPNLISFYLYDIVESESFMTTLKDIVQIEHTPMLVLLGVRFVITYRQKSLDLVHFVVKDYVENFQMSGKTPAFIVFLLLQHSLHNYSRINLANVNFLDKLATSLLTKRIPERRDKLATAGLNILTLNKLNINTYIILSALVTKISNVVSAESRHFFTHLLNSTEEIRNSIDSARHSLDSIISSIHAENTRETEKIVRTLTIISGTFMPLTLITGIYGMNFTRMPELQWYYGYELALGLMLLLALSLLFTFWRLGWFKKGSY